MRNQKRQILCTTNEREALIKEVHIKNSLNHPWSYGLDAGQEKHGRYYM